MTSNNAGKLRVTQSKSTFGELRSIISSVKGLGLRRRHHSVVVINTPENRGMINAAIHLLKVEEAK
jgi:large subunit ribosomal protein L30